MKQSINLTTFKTYKLLDSCTLALRHLDIFNQYRLIHNLNIYIKEKFNGNLGASWAGGFIVSKDHGRLSQLVHNTVDSYPRHNWIAMLGCLNDDINQGVTMELYMSSLKLDELEETASLLTTWEGILSLY